MIDLGIDVPRRRSWETAKKENIKIVALSGVLTLAIDSMKATVAAFKAAGMDDVKIIIGGAPVSEDAMKITGADEWAHSPPEDRVRVPGVGKGQLSNPDCRYRFRGGRNCDAKRTGTISLEADPGRFFHGAKARSYPHVSFFVTWKILDSGYKLSEAMNNYDIMGKVVREH